MANTGTLTFFDNENATALAIPLGLPPPSPITPSTCFPRASATAALANRFNTMGRGFANVSSVRLQVLRVDSQALSPEDRAQLRQLFLSGCQLLSQHLSAKQ